MQKRLARWVLVVAAIVVGTFLVAVAPWRDTGNPRERPAEPDAVASRPLPATPPADQPGHDDAPQPTEATGAADPGDPLTAFDDESGKRWSTVDLNAVRAAMPDNLYWTMSVPTKDPAVLQARQAERERWNVEYGKVLSSTATEQEIRDFYAHRQRVSLDSIEFANYLLAHHGPQLPERDVGMLKLAVKLHLARLEELPRQIAEALDRSKAHDAARRAWQEDQAAFDSRAPASK
jgi:hypothetical protein